jgi:hypothetical protein
LAICAILTGGIAFAGMAMTSAELEETIQVGRRKQLFLDDFVIARMEGVRRVAHSPQKHHDNPIVRADRPWELFVRSPVTAVYDREAKLFHMWYHAYGPPGGPAEGAHAAYARSRDGIHWEKPALGLFALEGSTENNLLNAGMRSVVINSGDPDPKHRFLGLSGGSVPMSAAGYYSADGLHWSKFAESSGDLRSTAARTPPNPDARFLFITQTWAGRNAWGAMRRGVMRADSENFAEWGGYRVIFAAGPEDPPNLEFYSMEPADFRLDHPYHGLYLGFLWCFHTDLEGKRNPVNNVAMSGTIDVELAVSRDSVHWQRVAPGTPFLGLGPVGAFDSGMVFLCSMVEYRDRLYFYYDGWDREHGDLGPARPAIGLATLRLDGFASLDPVGARGTVVTRPFVLEGDALRVNAYARRGKILVEVLDASGRVRPGFSASDCKPVTEDGLRLRVRWQKRALSELRSQVIRLRFHLRGRAELYAFQIDRAGE